MKILRYSSALLALIILACPTPSIPPTPQKDGEPLSTARDRFKDFDTLISAGNGDPEGIWSDGTTMWVADWRDAKIYAYSMRTKARDSAKDFDTLRAAGNGHPEGIWSDGTTMWVADGVDEKIYAYSMSTKERTL